MGTPTPPSKATADGSRRHFNKPWAGRAWTYRELNTTGASLMRGADIAAQDTGTVETTNDMHLALLCCHAGTQLRPELQQQSRLEQS